MAFHRGSLKKHMLNLEIDAVLAPLCKGNTNDECNLYLTVNINVIHSTNELIFLPSAVDLVFNNC